MHVVGNYPNVGGSRKLNSEQINAIKRLVNCCIKLANESSNLNLDQGKVGSKPMSKMTLQDQEKTILYQVTLPLELATPTTKPSLLENLTSDVRKIQNSLEESPPNLKEVFNLLKSLRNTISTEFPISDKGNKDKMISNKVTQMYLLEKTLAKDTPMELKFDAKNGGITQLFENLPDPYNEEAFKAVLTPFLNDSKIFDIPKMMKTFTALNPSDNPGSDTSTPIDFGLFKQMHVLKTIHKSLSNQLDIQDPNPLSPSKRLQELGTFVDSCESYLANRHSLIQNAHDIKDKFGPTIEKLENFIYGTSQTQVPDQFKSIEDLRNQYNEILAAYKGYNFTDIDSLTSELKALTEQLELDKINQDRLQTSSYPEILLELTLQHVPGAIEAAEAAIKNVNDSEFLTQFKEQTNASTFNSGELQ